MAESIETRVKRVLSEVLGTPFESIQLSTPVPDLMTDELDGDAIIISLQEEFDVDITSHQEEQLLQARVGQMISWIEDAVTE